LTARKETKTNFGFIPDTGISNHLNVRQVLGDTTTREYFDHFTNKSFHDLTTGKLIPAAAACILENGLKFIPNPKKSIHRDNIDEAMRWFTWDAYLKVLFANKDATDEEDEEIEPLRVNSKWMPTAIPNNIASRVGNFDGAFTRHFCPCNGKLNMTKFQATILQSTCENENIIIAHTDKNLGPVGVETNLYIRWALDNHLLDASTY